MNLSQQIKKSGNMKREPGPLLSIPPELRLKIYDALFDDLILQTQASNIERYVRTQRWPRKTLYSYSSLTKTSKLIRKEAKPHFERYFLSGLVAYFWNIPALETFAEEMRKLGGPYLQVQYSLRVNLLSEYHAFYGVEEVYNFKQDLSNFIDAQEPNTIEITAQDMDFLLDMRVQSANNDQLAGEYELSEGYRLSIRWVDDNVVWTLHYPTVSGRSMVRLVEVPSRQISCLIIVGKTSAIDWTSYNSGCGQRALNRYIEWRDGTWPNLD